MEIANPGSNTKPLQRCDTCNARLRPERLSLLYMMHRLKEDVFGAERGLFVTIRHLFSRPQDVTSGFIKGDNQRYFSPLKYFMVMLALSLFLPNDSILDDFVIGFVGSLKIISPQAAKAFVHDWNALVYLPMVALLALTTRGFFREKGYNYAEHLVVASYGWAQMVLLGALAFTIMHFSKWLGVNTRVVTPLFFIPYFYWLWYCRAIFSQRTLSGWLRALATLPSAIILYFVLIGFALSLAYAWIRMFA